MDSTNANTNPQDSTFQASTKTENVQKHFSSDERDKVVSPTETIRNTNESKQMNPRGSISRPSKTKTRTKTKKLHANHILNKHKIPKSKEMKDDGSDSENQYKNEDDTNVMSHVMATARHLIENGRDDEALEFLQSERALNAIKSSRSNPELILFHESIANVQQHLDRAAAEVRQVIQSNNAVDEEHDKRSDPMHMLLHKKLAEYYIGADEREKGLDALTIVLSCERAQFGSNDKRTLDTLNLCKKLAFAAGKVSFEDESLLPSREVESVTADLACIALLNQDNRRDEIQNSEDLHSAYAYLRRAGIFQELGYYEDALSDAKQCLDIRERIHRDDHHPSLAKPLSSMATIYGALGMYQKSIAYHQRALPIMEKVHGHFHPETAKGFTNIGYELSTHHHYIEAYKCYKTANEILKKVLGMDNVDTASTFSDLGIVLQSLGRHAKALDCLKTALDIQNRVLPGNHPQTAVVLDNIGSVLNDMNKKEEALDYYKRALAIHQNAPSDNNGPDQELIAIVYNNIASVLSSMHQYEEALDNCNNAIAIHENTLCRNHPHQDAFYGNEAKALEGLEAFYGNKAKALGGLERYDDASLAIRRAIEIHDSREISNDTDMKRVLQQKKLVEFLYNAGHCYEALNELRSVLAVERRVLGACHPETQETLSLCRVLASFAGKETFEGNVLDPIEVLIDSESRLVDFGWAVNSILRTPTKE